MLIIGVGWNYCTEGALRARLIGLVLLSLALQWKLLTVNVRAPNVNIVGPGWDARLGGREHIHALLVEGSGSHLPRVILIFLFSNHLFVVRKEFHDFFNLSMQI